jgi:hypothetical protein
MFIIVNCRVLFYIQFQISFTNSYNFVQSKERQQRRRLRFLVAVYDFVVYVYDFVVRNRFTAKVN